ncbi:MAG: copper amine oxidase N-terminal domain-containing protein [Desulfotomaculaceae bacterium]|nr:copper amine oxidase N-terminal domain-containing protein [Desulfotomaculaceae bacterium]
MKLRLLVVLAVYLVLTAPAPAVAADISLYVNGAPVYSDVSPEVEGRDVLLPLRAVAEALGAVVFYDEITQTVYVNKNDLAVEIPIGKHTGVKNGHAILLKAPPKIINGRTLITREALRNALGVKAIFNVHMNCILVE